MTDISNDNYNLLKKIVTNSYTSLEETDLSKKKLLYNIDKVNDYIKSFGIGPITIVNERFVVPDELKDMLQEISPKNKRLYLSKKERIICCELLIESEFDVYQLKDLMSVFSISKNTACSDIKELSAQLSQSNLSILYTRKDGYIIEGSELTIRKRIAFLLDTIVENYDLEKYYIDLCGIDRTLILDLSAFIKMIEDNLQVHFVESKIKSFPYLLAIFLKRIANGHKLKDGELFFNEINDTFEVKTVSKMLDDKFHLEMMENYYITLLILSTSVSKFNLINSELKEIMNKAIEKTIDAFEKNACIKFSERDKLQMNILQHLIAAYYRIKYDLSLSKDMIEAIKLNANTVEFQKVSEILEKSIYPLSNFFGLNKIPDVEKNFLVLQFCAWMKRENLVPISKIKAVVVCKNGVTISNMMYFTLKEIFPEFYFTKFVSTREFYELSDEEFDVVFSNIYLETNKKLFIVDNIIDLQERDLLRRKVFEKLYGFASSENELEIIYRTIDSFLDENQSQKLKSIISKTLQKHREREFNDDTKNYSLSDLLPISRIKVVNSVKDYVEAINIVSKPLLDNKKIEKRYVDKILENYNYECPNIVFGNEVAVPHARFEDGANELSMSLLKINKGVLFGENCLIHIVVMLAPIDTNSHLNALIQLYDLVTEENDVHKIIQARKKEEIKEIIDKYSNKERRGCSDD